MEKMNTSKLPNFREPICHSKQPTKEQDVKVSHASPVSRRQRGRAAICTNLALNHTELEDDIETKRYRESTVTIQKRRKYNHEIPARLAAIVIPDASKQWNGLNWWKVTWFVSKRQYCDRTNTASRSVRAMRRRERCVHSCKLVCSDAHCAIRIHKLCVASHRAAYRA